MAMPSWARVAHKRVWLHRRKTGIALHRVVMRRFVRGWPLLDRFVWPVLYAGAARVGADLRHDHLNPWGPDGLPALILEDAYWWAVESSDSDPAASKAKMLADEVRRLDTDILELCAELADRLRRRTEIQEFHGIGTDWTGPGLDFEHAIVAAVGRFPNFRNRVERPLSEFVRIAHQTSVSGPSLADLLEGVSASNIGELWAEQGADRAAMRMSERTGSATAGQAMRLRRFLAMLDEGSMIDRHGRRLIPADWLNDCAMSVLLAVASVDDPKASSINTEQVRKLRARIRRDAGPS